MIKIIDNPKDKSLKTIILGDSVDNERQYSIHLLSPMCGFKLGLGVAKLLAGCFDSIKDSDFDLKDSAKSISLLISALANIDTDQYLNLMNQALANNYCAVKYRDKTVNLQSENDKDRWFEDHRSDLVLFSASALWLNASPFLPDTFQNAIQNFKQAFLSNSAKTK